MDKEEYLEHLQDVMIDTMERLAKLKPGAYKTMNAFELKAKSYQMIIENASKEIQRIEKDLKEERMNRHDKPRIK
jgi:hypothetical protein